VALLVEQGEEDVEGDRRQRQKLVDFFAFVHAPTIAIVAIPVKSIVRGSGTSEKKPRRPRDLRRVS
jgi:hypothetical protein